MTKALFKLLWDIGLVDLAKMLGFRSPKALAACQSASGMYIGSAHVAIMIMHAVIDLK
jgi:hypothetical protein